MIKYKAYITIYEVCLPKKLNLNLESGLLKQLSLKVWSRGPVHRVVHEVKMILLILRHHLVFPLSFSHAYIVEFSIGYLLCGIQRDVYRNRHENLSSIKANISDVPKCKTIPLFQFCFGKYSFN